jgi:hypothetical protein
MTPSRMQMWRRRARHHRSKTSTHQYPYEVGVGEESLIPKVGVMQLGIEQSCFRGRILDVELDGSNPAPIA